ADEPFRPFGAPPRVDHGVPRLRELDLEILDDGRPETVGLVDRDRVQLVVVAGAELACEPRHVRLLDELRRRLPDELAQCDEAYVAAANLVGTNKGGRMKARILAEENRKWLTLAAVSFGLFMIML